jgi:voltage-gated potassium channel Kch
MPRAITLRDRLRYRFDNLMARGPIALIGWLFLVSAIVVTALAGALFVSGIDPDHRSFAQDEWAALLRALDTGTIANDQGSWPFLFLMLAVTIAGIFLVSTLIGIMTTGINARLERLRKGRSFVAETDHTLVLGWSPQVFTIVREIAQANENQRRGCIAVLAEKDAGEMQDELRARVPHTGRTRVVCRTGSPLELADLDIVNPHGARSIIIVAPESDDPDAFVIKTVLALTNHPDRRPEPYHIVAVIRDRKNWEAAKLVGGSEVEIVLAPDLIARVTAQTCRQSGLSVAYTELLDFGGDEIYFKPEPSLAGKTFGEALFAYEDSALIGLRFADGRIALNPPMDTRIGVDDRVIAISRDDDTIRLSRGWEAGVDEDAIRTPPCREKAPEHTLVLGWNDRAGPVIGELDAYVGEGSTVLLVAEDAAAEAASIDVHRFADRPLANLTVTFRRGDTTDRRTLDALHVERFDHVIVLSDADGAGGDPREAAAQAQQADARTLITLLHLRDIGDRQGRRFSIVSEMLDIRNRELAQVTRADDFIVSDNLVSLMLSQIAENRELAAVFDDLFDPAGSEIYLKPAADFVHPGRPVTFYTVVEAARRQGQVAIGYRVAAQAYDARRAYGVRLNPRKTEPVVFAEEDRIVVLAEE